MWNLKCKIMPVINGATGIVTKGLRKNLEVIPGSTAVGNLNTPRWGSPLVQEKDQEKKACDKRKQQ